MFVRKSLHHYLWYLIALSGGTITIGEEANPIYEAIVRVDNTARAPDYFSPWKGGKISKNGGTGLLVGPNLFLTNAHVVSNSQLIYLKKVNDPTPLKARILHIAHDCDLALLELEEPGSFEGVTPLSLGDGLPKLDSQVRVVGFPIGGTRMSVTRGIVSRIDFRNYSHTRIDSHLVIQVDAAINPGNSGGPAIQDDKVIGVAFQGYRGSVAQNTGYIIPIPVIKRFLKDIEDGSYDQYVDLPFRTTRLLNPAQRKALKLDDYPDQGIMVTKIFDPKTNVQTGDVLLTIDGKKIASDLYVEIDGRRVNMDEVVERKFRGDNVKIEFLRDGEMMQTEIALARFSPAYITAKKFDEEPQYVLFCGLLFQPFNYNMYSANRLNSTRLRYIYSYFLWDKLYEEKPEILVLTTYLKDGINSDLTGFRHKVVDRVNGESIQTLKQLYEALTPDEQPEFFVIDFLGGGRPMVINGKQAQEAHSRIMKKYNIGADSHLLK